MSGKYILGSTLLASIIDPTGRLAERVILTGAQRDAFGRIRTSEPFTLFDSKQLHDSLPLYYDDQEVSGSLTTSTHSPDRASTTITVNANTAGKRVRQTFQRFNYQPGKSQLILCTGVLNISGAGGGISSAMGYFDDANGVFIQVVDGVIGMVIRSSVSGSAVDNRVAQSAWNGDNLDGTGASGITLDASKAQIWWADLEWLGVGTVRTGVVIDGAFILCHTFNHANTIDSVYMSTPNLPIRYEIENDGTGVSAALEHICSTVISEGGQQATGQLHTALTGNAKIPAAQDDLVGLIGIHLKSTHIDTQVDLTTFSVLNDAKEPFEWSLWINPTIAGTFTFTDHENGSCQVAIGDENNTLTGGHMLSAGVAASSREGGDASADLRNALRLGSKIDGTPDEIVLAVKSYKANGKFDAALGWRELS